jgi:hypothetical protein
LLTPLFFVFSSVSELVIGVIIINPVFMSMFLKCITYDINANVLGFSIWSKSSIMKSSLISGDLSFSFSPYFFLYFKYSKIQLVSRSGVVKE